MQTAYRTLGTTICLAAAVFISGCVFPFTRGSDANLDKVIAAEEQAAKSTNDAPQVAKKPATLPGMLQSLFSRKDKPNAEPSSQPPKQQAPQPSANETATENRAPTKKKPNPLFSAFRSLSSGSQNEVDPAISPNSNVAASVAPITPVPEKKVQQLPKIVAPPQQASTPSQTSQVAAQHQAGMESASQFSAASKLPPPSMKPPQLDGFVRSPWEGNEFQMERKRNLSVSSLQKHITSTIADSGTGPIEAPPAAHEKPIVHEPTSQFTHAIAQPSRQPVDPTVRQSVVIESPEDSYSNPLRGDATHSLRPQQSAPQIVENTTIDDYPATQAEPMRWKPAPEITATAGPTPPEDAASDVVVNPYVNDKEVTSTTPFQPEPVVASQPDPDEIHFHSSLSSRLAAANQQVATVYNKTEPLHVAGPSQSQSQPKPQEQTASFEPTIPQPQSDDLKVSPKIIATMPNVEDTPAETELPKVVQTKSKQPELAPVEVIQPFVIGENPTSMATPRVAALPSKPAAISIPASPKTSNTKLPPVVRASRMEPPKRTQSTKVFVIRGD